MLNNGERDTYTLYQECWRLGGNETIAPQVSCPSGRLPVKTFARQSFARHVKDVCPSRCLPVSRLPVKTFARQFFALTNILLNIIGVVVYYS